MRWLLTIAGIILVAVFGALIKVWAGFQYFALSFTIALCVYWTVMLIIDYRHTYNKKNEDGFNLYIANLVNSTNLTLDVVEKSRDYYLKKFHRSQWKEKLIEVTKIIFILGIALACIAYIITKLI